MNSQWAQLSAKIDGMELRERVLVFVAAVSVLTALLKFGLLDPLSNRQTALSAQMQQQQQQLSELQNKAQMQSASQNQHNNELDALRNHLTQLKQQLQEQDEYLQSRQDRLVEPNMMPGLLRQVLDKNDHLQLVELKTLPVGLLIEKPVASNDAGAAAAKPADQNMGVRGQLQSNVQKRIFKHGVQITVRGGYLDMLRYVAALEKLPMRMFWGEASLIVDKYPDGELTLTLYTLSLDKTWLTV